MRLGLAFALLLLPLAFAGARDDAKKDDKKSDSLAGTWTVTKFEADGQPGGMIDSTLSFKDGKYSVRIGKQEVENGEYKVDLEKKPAHLDFDIKSGNDEGKKQPGLFKIDGDKLIVALAMPGAEKRPEKLESGKGVVYAELKKGKQ